MCCRTLPSYTRLFSVLKGESFAARLQRFGKIKSFLVRHYRCTLEGDSDGLGRHHRHFLHFASDLLSYLAFLVFSRADRYERAFLLGGFAPELL